MTCSKSTAQLFYKEIIKKNIMNDQYTELTNYFCQEKLDLEEILSRLKEVLKDTDDKESKDKIEAAIQQVSAAYRILVVGAEESGRTSLLEHIFMEEASGSEGSIRKKTHGIEEIRFGAAEAALTIDETLTRRFSTNKRLEGLALTDIGEESFYEDPRVIAMAADSQAVLAVFSSENIQNPKVWSFIETYCQNKKIVCILNKSDLYPPEIMEKKEKRLQGYMEEAGIRATLFTVTLKEDRNGLKELCHYIREAVLGKCPVMEKHAANIALVSSLTQELRLSFLQRRRQFEEDQKILLYMDEKMNDFYQQQQDKAKRLKSEVFSVISQEIDNYRDCIIKKLDPKKIQDDMDISDKNAFKEWLQHELEKRERILKQKVQDQTQRVMRWYYDDLASVYGEVTKRLEGRKKYIGLEDRFYGSLQSGKQEIVHQTLGVAQSSQEQFSSLSQVTEEFYDKVKRENKRYDRMKQMSAMAGSALSGGAAVLGGYASGMATAGLVSTLLPIMGALVVGTAGVYAGMKLFECLYGGHFEKNMEKHISEFSNSVEGIKEAMISQVGEQLEQVFGQMLSNADKAFLMFRTTTNIDSRNLPLLEDKMQSMEQLFDHFTKSLEVV